MLHRADTLSLAQCNVISIACCLGDTLLHPTEMTFASMMLTLQYNCSAVAACQRGFTRIKHRCTVHVLVKVLLSHLLLLACPHAI